MRAASYGIAGVLWLICGHAALCQGVLPERDGTAHLTRQQLVGAWRLVGIDYTGPGGPIADPFYQTGSTGILIYEPTGWMSVHIVAPHRYTWGIPESRLGAGAPAHARSKAEAFDSYYAYFGTWSFDAATSVVTHHVMASLIPAETGIEYAQKATLEDGRLIFTGRGGEHGPQTVRRKVWERITGGADGR